MHGSIQVSLCCFFTVNSVSMDSKPFISEGSFILIASSLVFHPCLLHKISEGWFFMTLLSN